MSIIPVRSLKQRAWILLLPLIIVGTNGCLRFGWDRLSRKVPPEVMGFLQKPSFENDQRTLKEIGQGQRTPFTKAEQSTLKYLVRRFRQLGLEPAGNDGYLQSVEVDAIALRGAKLEVAGQILVPGGKLAIWTEQPRPLVEVEAKEIVFVGYGITAPERGHDDYRGLDLHGRCALVLMGDPRAKVTGNEAPAAGSDGPGTLAQGPPGHGEAVSWYARWRYKVNEAARHGAMGVVLVHEERGTGSSWRDWKKGFTTFRIQQHLSPVDSLPTHPLDFVAVVSSETGDLLLREAAIQPARARVAARERGFRGRVLSVSLHATIESEIRRTRSFNVVGEIPGRYDEEKSLVIAAEWDQGDHNATACASLLALAGAFGSLAQAPARSVEFVAATLSTRGHLGMQEFTHHPHRDLDECAAAFTLSAASPSCVMYSELGNVLQSAAQEDHHTFENEDDPWCWLNSASLVFARAGVPSASVACGPEDLAMLLRGAYHLAQSKGGPRWTTSSSFRFYPR